MKYIMPDMLAGNAEKDSLEFGKRMAQYIDSEWGSMLIAKERSDIQMLRSHMKGEVNASHLKPLFNTHKDLSALRVNWKYSSEMPRFVNAIVEGFSYDKYRTVVTGVDMHSQEARSRFRREKLKAMYTKEEAEQLSRLMGMDFRHQGFVPESKDELNTYMELEYKQASEIASEIAIQKVFDFSDWRETFNHIAEDLAVVGRGVARVVPDSETVCQFEYNDVANFIYSRDVDNTRDASKCFYFGQYMAMTLSQVEKIGYNELPPDKLRSLANLSGFRGDYRQMSGDDKQNTVDVMYFTFKANRYDMKKKKYNRHGGYKYIDKDDYWLPNPNMKSDALAIPYEVWYEGYYVPGAECVFGYKLVDDMMRDPGNSRKAIPPFIMFTLSSESIGRKIVDISDDIYITRIKIRQFVLKLKPKGYAIDIDGLGTLEMGDGTKLTPIQQVKIMRDDGDLLFSGSSLIDDSGNVRMPIHDMPDSQGRELMELINVYNTLVSQLHTITGINPQAVGGAPPPRTSESVYSGTVSSSLRVVNNIFNGLMSIQKRASEAIMARLHAAAVFGETEPVVRAIMGEYTTDMIKEVANIHKYQFIVNVDLRSTEAERAQFVQAMNEALQTGAISIEDKIDIEEIENLKLAKHIIKTRYKKRMLEAQKNAEIEHQRKMEQLQAAGVQDMQRERMKMEMDKEMMMFKAELETRTKMFEAQSEMEKVSLTKQWEMAIEKEKSSVRRALEGYKEDRKDKRVSLQSTRQSELIDQRQSGAGPKKFEERSTEDVMKGVNPFAGLSPNI